MKYLRKFDSVSDMETAIASSEIGILGLVYDNGQPVVNAKPTPPNPRTLPFYIDVRGSVTLAATSGLQMSTDGENWEDTTATTLSSGKTYFRVATDQPSPLKPNWTEGDSSDYDIGGNINSLVKVNFEEDTTCYSFYDYFMFMEKLKSVGNLVLPATTLESDCYSEMFSYCTSLTTAPVLPATTLAQGCYNSMFIGCTSLTTAPALPATTLADSCYSAMFQDCTSLTTAPALPATTLAQSCYNSMFRGCTALTTAHELPATTLVDNCYRYMFGDCTSLVTTPDILPATTLANNCYYEMFDGCTSLTTAPALPATILADSCYRQMFFNCKSLTMAPELPTITLVQSCYEAMFYGCTKINYIKCLATDISATKCINNWVSGVSSTGTFVKNAGITLESWGQGKSGIPENWTVQDAQ